jgi:hypothetical protein
VSKESREMVRKSIYDNIKINSDHDGVGLNGMPCQMIAQYNVTLAIPVPKKCSEEEYDSYKKMLTDRLMQIIEKDISR